MATALNELVRTARRAADADRLAGASDAELLDRLHPTWDAAAFEALVRRHARTVLAAARAVQPDDADVSDAFQATFLVLLRDARRVRRGPLGPWLYGVARRVVLKARAKAAAVKKREAKAARAEPRTDADPGWRETCDLLVRELARLPESFRRPLELCYFDGLTREEAAAVLGVSCATVRGRLERGRDLLRRRLEARGVALSVGMLVLALVNSAAAVSPRLIQAALSAASGSAPPAVAAIVEEITVTGIKKGLALLAVFAVGVVGLSLWGWTDAAARPDDKPAMKADVPKAKPADPKVAKTISGFVVGPDGKPVPDATLELKTASASLVKNLAGKPAGVSDADGKFKIEVPKDVLHFWLLARKDGFGVAWLEPEYPTGAFPAQAKLELVKDFPVAGRVLDTEGKPVAGVTVTVRDVIEPMNRDLDKLLKGSANGGFGTVGQWEKVLFDPVPPATTDKDGKFAISGLGAERVVGLAVHGKGFARQSGFVFTRAGVDVEPLNRQPKGSVVTGPGQHPVMYPANPTFVVGTGYSLTGVVTNNSTGKPIPDCEVEMIAGFWDHVRVRTDAAGKYTLDGLTKGTQHHVLVTPPASAGVFATWKTVARTDADKPVSLDFALAKGAIFKGKVIDKETKEPVRAQFQIVPTADNEYAKRPEYETANRDMVWRGGSEDHFRITTVPGKSKVAISVVPMKTLHGQPFHPYRAGQSLEIDLPADGEKDHVIEVERGRTATVNLVDEAGKPVPGAAVLGLTYTNQDGVDQPRLFTLPGSESKFTVYGLSEKEKRQVVVLHREKKLVGTLRVGAGADEKLTLVPFQPLIGRFTDVDGKPLAGLTVGIDYEGYGEGPLVGEEGGFVLHAKTDADGKFTIPAVVPGLPFTFSIQKGNTRYGGVPKLGRKVVEVGKPLDLGSRKLEILD